MKEIIEIEFDQEIECSCGNKSHLAGFYPCNDNGEYVEPIASEWDDLYKCDRCGQIFRQVGYNARGGI